MDSAFCASLGLLTMSTLFDFQSKVRTNTSRVLMLDFTNVPYVDSAGIGVMVGAYVTHQKDGRSLYLIGVNERVQNALKVTHVEKFFHFVDSVDCSGASDQVRASVSVRIDCCSPGVAGLSLKAWLPAGSPFCLLLSSASFAGITDDVREALARAMMFRRRGRTAELPQPAGRNAGLR